MVRSTSYQEIWFAENDLAVICVKLFSRILLRRGLVYVLNNSDSFNFVA